MANADVKRMCLYCGAETTHHLGVCKFCGVGVCHKCGNLQVSKGEHFAAHDACLRQNDTGFSMIKFIK